MLKTIALAGVAAALVIGSIAVAQTTTTGAYGNPNTANTGAMNNNGYNNNGNIGATAPSATQHGVNTAATAGERG